MRNDETEVSGAPQSGGMSGVAAQPGEGALALSMIQARGESVSPRAPEAEPADAAAGLEQGRECELMDSAAIDRDGRHVEATFGWNTPDAAWHALGRLINRARRVRELTRENHRLRQRLAFLAASDGTATPAPTGERAGGEAGVRAGA